MTKTMSNCLFEVYLMHCENCPYWDSISKKCLNPVKNCYKLMRYHAEHL